jgi:hypothetical protein
LPAANPPIEAIYYDETNDPGPNDPEALYFTMAFARSVTKYWKESLANPQYLYTWEYNGLDPLPSVDFGSSPPDQATQDAFNDEAYAVYFATDDDMIWWEEKSWTVGNIKYTQSRRGFWRGIGHQLPYGVTSSASGATGSVRILFVTWPFGQDPNGPNTVGGDEDHPLAWPPHSTWSYETCGGTTAPAGSLGNVTIAGWAVP